MTAFVQLWANHPTIKGDTPLLDRSVYPNQCAINMSASLMRSSVDMTRYSGARSWQEGKPRYAIRAEELAHWLETGAAHLPTKLTKFTGKEAKNSFERVDAKTGIIFLKDYYGPGMSGDHIDLFNGSRLTERTSWFRIQWGISWNAWWSDFRRAKEIWFWQMS